MKQISMFENTDVFVGNPNSKQFFDNIIDILTASEKIEMTPKLSSASAYDLISFDAFPADIRIKFGKKVSYFSVPTKYKRFVDKYDYRIGGSKLWLIIDIQKPDDAYIYSKLFCDIYDYRFFENSPNSFDCCSRYMECSNAKKCIHTIPEVKRYCRYKTKLAKNTIIYGKNRNIK